MKIQANPFLVSLILLLSITPSLFAADNISRASRSTILKEINERGETMILVELSSSGSRIPFQDDMDDEMRKGLVGTLQKQMIASLSSSDRTKVVHQYQYVPGLAMLADEEVLTRLENNPAISGIFENGMRKPSLSQSTPLVFANQESSRLNGNNEWAVAVLDTGVDKNHTFLKIGSTKKVVSEACYSRGGYSTNYPEIDSLCPGNSYTSTSVNSGLPCSGYSGCDHGTHVAGIAVGDGTSFDGVATQGKLLAIQVFTGLRDIYSRNICGTGVGRSCIVAFDIDILRALERVYSLRNSYKIASVNMSLGGGSFSGSCDGKNSLMTSVINNLKNAGIATVIASGNEYYSSSISFPACISSAISVGATYDSGGSMDLGTSYGNQSPLLDLYAPGSYINSSIPGGGYSVKQGTSMASPHVAGAWAVMKHARPNAGVNELESILKSVGPDILSRSGAFKRKRLDLSEALKRISPISVVPQNLLLLKN